MTPFLRQLRGHTRPRLPWSSQQINPYGLKYDSRRTWAGAAVTASFHGSGLGPEGKFGLLGNQQNTLCDFAKKTQNPQKTTKEGRGSMPTGSFSTLLQASVSIPHLAK